MSLSEEESLRLRSDDPTFADAQRNLAEAARMMARLGYLDVQGHISVRVSDSYVAITPSYGVGASPLSQLAPSDVVIVDYDGNVVAGRRSATFELPLHLAVYRARPSVGSVLFSSAPYTVAFGIARRPLLPLTHAEAWFGVQDLPSLRPSGFYSDPERAESVVHAIANYPMCHISGMGAVFVGENLVTVMNRCHTYEHLAQMNVLVMSLSNDARTVTAAEVAKIQADRGTGNSVQAVAQLDYFRSFDIPVPSGIADWADVADHTAIGVKRRIAVACRILASRGTLVEFREHVSERLPYGDSFAMSPAKSFARMKPEDAAIIGLEGDAEWIGGPLQPAPFRRYHRDIFAQRPDVRAIVHTHEMFGRAFALARRDLSPVFRIGVQFARQIPTLEHPSMVFSNADRAEAIQVLGKSEILHILAHGTDYLSSSLEGATVAAIHREQAYSTYHLALKVGEPRELSKSMISELGEHAPSAIDWWEFYAGLLAE